MSSNNDSSSHVVPPIGWDNRHNQMSEKDIMLGGAAATKFANKNSYADDSPENMTYRTSEQVKAFYMKKIEDEIMEQEQQQQVAQAGAGSSVPPLGWEHRQKEKESEKETETTKMEEASISPLTRSATTKNTDLSGRWELLVDDDFKKDYDRYLQDLGQSALVRSVALAIIGMTAEEIEQMDDGNELFIRGRNVRGNWERTLVASSEKEPVVVPILTADKEEVQSECWWEKNGKVHLSWLRGVKKYGGGDFESKRYLSDKDERILVCESIFHPRDSNKASASVTWRFQKQN
jgi:ribosomal protein L12E/L44/L45/RPP1/RPP2